MPKSAHTRLDFYRKRLSRKTVPVPCRHCGESFLPKRYENHVSHFHGFNPRLGCAWCEEKVWNASQKHVHVPHLIQCCEAFIRASCLPERPPRPPSPSLFPLPEILQLLILRHPYPEKDHFGVGVLPIHLLHEFIWTLPVWPIPLFQDENLNLAATYLLHYLELRGTHEFFHVMVKAVAMKSFIRAMDADKGKTHTLLFTCWCDGGKYEEARHRQHRHMIVVSPKGHFKEHVWKKVKIPRDEMPCPLYPCKSKQRIKSPMHLVNVLGYVSHRKSRCESDGSNRTLIKLHHFYLHKTLPADFRLPLALLWDGGLKQLLNDWKFRNVSISRLIQNPIVSVKGQWKQKIKHFYGHQRGLVVPVANGLMPTRKLPWEVACTFHLLEGERLYFEYSPENEALDRLLDGEDWMRKQAMAGNCFYDIVEEEMWTPRQRDQATLSLLMPREERIRELESNYSQLEKRYEEMQGETRAALDEARGRYEEEMSRLKTEIDSLKTEVARMKRQYEERETRTRDRYEEREARIKERYEEGEKRLKERYEEGVKRMKKLFKDEMAGMKKQYRDQMAEIKELYEDEMG